MKLTHGITWIANKIAWTATRISLKIANWLSRKDGSKIVLINEEFVDWAQFEVDEDEEPSKLWP